MDTDENKHKSDYFSYLDSPLNDSRYLPSTTILEAILPTKARVLDAGCGRASICRHVPSSWAYLGVDHSPTAITYCLNKYRGKRFICCDLVEFLQNALLKEPYDCIILCGILSHVVQGSEQTLIENEKIVAMCEAVLKPGGVLALLLPFAHNDEFLGHRFFEKANWKYELADKATAKTLRLKRTHRIVTDQVGVEKVISSQEMLPEWWVSKDTCPTSQYCGTYLGTLTLLYQALS